MNAKKKLLLCEAVITIVVISIFVLVFSLQHGRGEIGTEKYAVAVVISAIVAGAAALAFSTLVIIPAANADITIASVVAAFSTLSAGATFVFVTALVSAVAASDTAESVVNAAIAGVAVFIAVSTAFTAFFAIKARKKLGNFSIISLIAEALVIFGTISIITFSPWL